MLPVGFWKPLISFNGDIILFAYILGLSRFFQILAAMDIGSSFEGMGASREATFALFAEPIFFFTIGIFLSLAIYFHFSIFIIQFNSIIFMILL
jgi:formate hydrogenlyase subunit 4